MGRKYSTRKSRRVIKRSLRKANKRRTYKRRTYKTRKYKTRKNKYKGGTFIEELGNEEYWLRGQKLGWGGNSDVYKCTYAGPDGPDDIKPPGHTPGKEYAMKVLDYAGAASCSAKLLAEFSIHNSVDSNPHIPTLYAKWVKPECVIVMELSGVDFLALFSNNYSSYPNWLDLISAVKVFKQICNAVAALHNKNLVHNDIKLDNITLRVDDVRTDNSIIIPDLYHPDLQSGTKERNDKQELLVPCSAFLIDFGWSGLDGQKFPESEIINNTNITYGNDISAPYEDENKKNKAHDIWALGVLLCQLLLGPIDSRNFDNPDEETLNTEIEKLTKLINSKFASQKKFMGLRFKSNSFLNRIIELIIHIIKDLLSHKAADRPKITQVIKMVEHLEGIIKEYEKSL
jgi:serine/threonine protein kinase